MKSYFCLSLIFLKGANNFGADYVFCMTKAKWKYYTVLYRLIHKYKKTHQGIQKTTSGYKIYKFYMQYAKYCTFVDY